MAIYQRMCVKKDNRLGWVKALEYSVHQNFVDATTYSDAIQRFIPASGQIEFTLSGVAFPTSGVMAALRDWSENGIFETSYQREWMCLYCTSPNSIMRTHCVKCGAPRSFILG